MAAGYALGRYVLNVFVVGFFFFFFFFHLGLEMEKTKLDHSQMFEPGSRFRAYAHVHTCSLRDL